MPPNHTSQILESSVKSNRQLKLSKYTLIAQIYFFVNIMFLPKGLLYSNVMSPFFYLQVIRQKLATFWKPFFGFLLTFDFIHLFLGVDMKSFLLSNGLFISTYFCVISFYHFFNRYQKLGQIIKQIVLVNFVLAMLAIPFLFLEVKYQSWVWWVNNLTRGVTYFPRLKLLTYEASYYSLLLIPPVYYYLCKAIFKQFESHPFLNLSFVLIPLFMSLSFGVLGASIIMVMIMAFIFRKNLTAYKRPFFMSLRLLLLGILIFVAFIYLFPANPVTIRFYNVLAGTDTSANGRIFDSLGMAWRIADAKSIWFGAGLGQIKIQAEVLVRAYYSYWGNLQRYDIPNAFAETLAIFGIVGVCIRLGLAVYLFRKTKVSQNYFRLALFIFIFIYQFTGSYITNIAEYVIWLLAFSNVFPQFNIKTTYK